MQKNLGIKLLSLQFSQFPNTVKPVYNDHAWDPQKVAVVQMWQLFGGFLIKIGGGYAFCYTIRTATLF
jgi:hypothetical protein